MHGRPPVFDAASGGAAPRLGQPIVRRPHLEARIGPDTGAAWSLVVAPPGAGKTTLVRAALEKSASSWTWLTITGREPFTAVLATVAARSEPASVLDDPVATLLDHHDVGGPPHVFVVDDAQSLTAKDWSTLEVLLHDAPAGLHPIVISRVEPPIALGRERVSGRMAELRASDLAFGLHDTTQLLEAITHEDDRSGARQLYERTEGWVAGIRLAAVAVRDGADLGAIVDHLENPTSSVAEFLVEEVLDQLSDDHREIVLRASTVDVIEPDLCRALTGRDDGPHVLAQMAADGTFVRAVNGAFDRYEFHGLFAGLLRLEHRRSDADGERRARLIAADWFIDHGQVGPAVEQLMAVGEFDRAHSAILANLPALYVGPFRSRLDQWLTSIPDSVITANADRAVDHCAALALIADPDATRWWLYGNEHTLDDDRRRSRLDCILAVGHAVNGRLDEMRAAWESGRQRRPADQRELLDEVLATWEIRLETHLGSPRRATDLSRDLQAAPRQLLADAVVLSLLAGALDASGDRDGAEATAHVAITRWRDDGEPALPGMVDALTVAAAHARRDHRTDEARRLLESAEALASPQVGPNMLTALVAFERARIARAAGEPDWRPALRGLAEALRTKAVPIRLADELDVPRTTRPLGDWVDSQRRDIESSDISPVLRRNGVIAPRGSELTDRELEVLAELTTHRSLPEIASQLSISRHTVKTHVSRIYDKLGVATRSDAVEQARKTGLVETIA